MQTIVTADGVRLHTHEWLPANALAQAQGTVLVVHGLSEHAGRYAHVAAALNDAGWRVVGYDHRGHGRSQGPRGGIAAPHSLLADLGCVLDAARAAPGHAPAGLLVLLGDSMGGVVAGRYVAEALAAAPAAWSRPVDRLVLASPALTVDMTPFQKLLLAVLGPLAPNFAVRTGLDLGNLSHDPAVAETYRADPLVHEMITARLTRFIMDGAAETLAAAPRWRVPTLLMWGSADRIVSPAGSRTFAATAPASVVTAHEYAGLYHELFNEVQRADVLARLTGWLADR